MGNWYYKNLGDGAEAFNPTNEIQDAFLSLAHARPYSHDAAVFSKYDLGNNEVFVYFTPSAGLLARIFGAVSCEKPVPTEGFALLAGDANALKTHFPDHGANPLSSRAQ